MQRIPLTLRVVDACRGWSCKSVWQRNRWSVQGAGNDSYRLKGNLNAMFGEGGGENFRWEDGECPFNLDRCPWQGEQSPVRWRRRGGHQCLVQSWATSGFHQELRFSQLSTSSALSFGGRLTMRTAKRRPSVCWKSLSSRSGRLHGLHGRLRHTNDMLQDFCLTIPVCKGQYKRC